MRSSSVNSPSRSSGSCQSKAASASDTLLGGLVFSAACDMAGSSGAVGSRAPRPNIAAAAASLYPEARDDLGRDGMGLELRRLARVFAGPDAGLATFDREFTARQEREPVRDVETRPAEFADLRSQLDLVAELHRREKTRARID